MTSPQDLRGQVGGKVVIPCQAVGDPEPVISWMFNEKEITFDEDAEAEERTFTQLPSGALRIESFSADRMGDYRCKAVNMMGEVISRPARMSMEETSTPDRGNTQRTTTTSTAVPASGQQMHLSHVPEDVTIPLNDSIILHCAEKGMCTRWEPGSRVEHVNGTGQGNKSDYR